MRVAICDDEKTFLEQMEDLLREIEEISHIDKYDDIDKINQILEKESYDIIFMDLAWKGKEDTGVQFAASINDKYPNIQFVFVTAFNDKFAESIFFEKVNFVLPFFLYNLAYYAKRIYNYILYN